MAKFIQYLKDTRGELKHVSWPTQKQTIIFTVLVVIISIFVAFYLGLFDFIFTTGLDIFFFDSIPTDTLLPADHPGAGMEVPTTEIPISEPIIEPEFDLPSPGEAI